MYSDLIPLIILLVSAAIIIPLIFYFTSPKRKARKSLEKQQAIDAYNYNVFRSALAGCKFTPDRELNFHMIHFAVSSSLRRVYIMSHEIPSGLQLGFDEIINYEIIENGQIVSSSSTGATLAGGLLFGVAGAVVGSTMHNSYNVCNMLQLRITITNLVRPSIIINLITPPGTLKNGEYYYNAINFIKEVTATIDVIKNQRNTL